MENTSELDQIKAELAELRRQFAELKQFFSIERTEASSRRPSLTLN